MIVIAIVTYWRSFSLATTIYLFTGSFAGWLVALCRPQERGRQCAAIAID